MNTSHAQFGPTSGVPPCGDLHRSGHRSVASRLAGWFAALACLLLVATPARAHREPANCTGSGLGINLFTSIPDVHVGDTLYYSINVFNGIPNSGRVVCDAVGITAFVVTPDGVSHPITLVRTTLHQGEADFYPDVIAYVVRAQDIKPDGTVVATATDTGTIHQNDTDSTGGGFQQVNTEVNQPCVKILAQCVGGVGENGLITFTGTVTNCGNNTLVGVTVTNFHDTGFFTVLFPTNLARGQIASFSGSYHPSNPCGPNNATLTVLATDEFTSTPRTVTSFATITCPITTTPGIKVTKLCPVDPVSPGQLLTFSGSVSNTGNVTLTNIVVVNNQPAANTTVFTQNSLAPGEVANFTGSYLAPTNCSVSDTLTGTGRSICGVAVTSSASATCTILTSPQIAVVVNCPATPVLPGGTLVYSGTVQNTGDITLTNVVVVSDRPSANTSVFTTPSLAPGAIRTFTSSVTVPSGACAVTTTFSGRGKDVCANNTVTNTTTTVCNVTTTPAIVVTLICPTGTPVAGNPITYTGTVRNSGNVTLNNVFVVASQPGPNTPVIGPITLLPGVTTSFTTSFTTPADGCSVATTVNATGIDNCTAAQVASTATATCSLSTTPNLVLTQNCPIVPAGPNSLLTYSGTISNSGNVTITNVVIVNNLSGATPVFTAVSMAPGEVAGFTGSYLTTTNCSSTSTSTATGRSTCGVAITRTVTSTCSILTSPQIAVVVNCPATPILPGGSFTYSGTVQNTGDVTLTNIIVVSDRPSANTTVFTTVSLPPGAIRTFTSTVTVPANACTVTTTFSGRGKDVCANNTVTNTTTTTCTVTTAPGILVTLTCPTASATAGGLITYNGTVRNTGNVTLNNVFVVNNQPNANTAVIGPITLLPGVTTSFTTSFTTPVDACSVSSTVNAVGTDNCTGAQVASTATTICPLGTTPNLVLTQSCPVDPAVPGGLLTYSGTISNSGNVTITNVVILNNLSGASPIYTSASLAPGQSDSFTGSYLAPTNCSSTSTSTATGRSICGAAITRTISATCTILSTPQIQVTATCPPGQISPNGSFTYNLTVRNTGNITLTNIIVSSDRPSANTTVFTAALLAPGVITNFTSTVTVPVNACTVDTTFSARGKDVCVANSVTNTVTTTCTVTTTPAIAVTLNCPTVNATAGGPITYNGTVRNSGNVTLNNVFVVANQPGANTPVIGPITLLPGVTTSFTTTFTTPAGACSVVTTVNATGLDNCTGAAVSSSTSTTCTLATTPQLVLTQACPVVPAVPGGLLTYSGTISNAGNVTITNVVIVNNLSGGTPVFTSAIMLPGASATYSGSYLAPTNCSSTSTSTGTGRSVCGVAVTGSVSTTCTILTTPQVAITANCPAGQILPGSSFTYSLTVQNTGNITLTNVTVTSDRPSANTTVFTAALLAPGVITNFTSTVTVPVGACTVGTTFSVRGKDVCTPNQVTNTVTTTCTVTTTPAILVTLACPLTPPVTGGSITYNGTVRNSGNVTLNNVFVVANQPGANTPVVGPITLLPGVTTNFTYTFTSPANACSVTTTVNGAGNDNCTGTPVSSTATTTCTLTTTPGLFLTQSCPVNPSVPGALLFYSGTISNSGNITLTNVVVVNNQTGLTPVFSAAILVPGQTASYTGSYVTPTNCLTASISTGTARSICGVSVSNTAGSTCPILTTPAIVVTQTCPVIPVAQGGILTYSGTVSNAGNITLTNIIVVNNQPGSNTVIFTRASLAPGVTAAFSGSYQVPTNCCVVSSTVRASGQGCDGVTVTDSSTRTCTVLTVPRITVTKVCAPGTLRPGDLLTYSGIVSNAGNITLINVFVSNTQPPAGAQLLGPLTLAPGETATYTTSYVVPPDFCGSDTVTATGQDVCTYLSVNNSVTSTCPIQTAPRITITKVCPALPTPRGSLYVFSGSVSNAGNVTLLNVYVTDNQPTNNTPVAGPLTLAPGATASFTGSYVVPPCFFDTCCFIVDTLTARGQDRCSSSNVTATATAVCPLLNHPAIGVVQNCPANPIPMGSLYQYSGYVTNTGDIVLTNVFVAGPLGNTVLGPIELAPHESEFYLGSYTVPANTCSVTITGRGQDTCGGNAVTNTASCLVATAPQITVTETCPPGPVPAGTPVAFGGQVSNTGNVTLTNVYVFSSQSTNGTTVLGPITLAPGASAPFSGGYLTSGGSNPTTNSTVVTNSSLVITTNTTTSVVTNPPTATKFVTINTITTNVVDRFTMGTNFQGVTYAPEDHGYAATQFYAIHKDTSGVSFFDTITASTGTTTDRFSLGSTRTFDALAYAAPDVGYGPVIFYYLSHDSTGVESFGTITPGGVVGVVTDRFVVGTNFDALTFTATDLGYGANLFYYVRHDANGLSTFGTINPALPGTVTDRFTIGTNVDALVFTALTAPGYGANNFYYLRHNTNGVATFGTIFITSLTTALVTDRFTVGTNAVELTFTSDNPGSFGANLFYALRGSGTSFTTNNTTTFTTNAVTTFVTNSVVSYTTTNTVSASGMDFCLGRTVTAAADCIGAITPSSAPRVSGARNGALGTYSLTFQTELGQSYTVQYKNALSDPDWTDLETVIGTGNPMTITDPDAGLYSMRFYRLMTQ